MREMELLLIDKKEWTTDIHHNAEDSQKHHAEQKKEAWNTQRTIQFLRNPR